MYKCNFIQDVPKMIEKATEFENHYDIDNVYRMQNIVERINELKVLIDDHQNNITYLQDQKANIRIA